ncbi:hypothetical protein C5167_025115 [Papaver somniferum]|uniref:Uncharacterized protein n=1 Tax=Papaver somniferum TaxID=3469 RepID=A0A4Y7JTG1_PAPSO|nr:hypothetical protein C5167_025115 [Papaver somniferum]
MQSATVKQLMRSAMYFPISVSRVEAKHSIGRRNFPRCKAEIGTVSRVEATRKPSTTLAGETSRDAKLKYVHTYIC